MRTDKLRHILAQTLTSGTKRGEAKGDPTASTKDADETAEPDGEPLPPPSSQEQ